MRHLILTAGNALLIAALLLRPHVVAGQAKAMSAALPPLGANASVIFTADNLGDVLAPQSRPVWQPKPATERPRGGVEIYAAAAPAVVVVRTADGHGTGFFISADGLLVTNHHVINTGLTHAPDASSATVHIGQMGTAGIMDLRSQGLRAVLYKSDPVRDLALLKVQPLPGQPAKFPFIKLSATAPRPGMDCAIIGHPSSGMLWTYRPCQVSSVGTWPKDLVNLVMTRLTATGANRQSVEEFIATQSNHRIMLTSAQANPGDSGGPVLDPSGALMGVTFAGPGNQAEDKFTYHVHLDEVRSFVANTPQNPMLLVPNPWSLPARTEVRDVDGDTVLDLLVAGDGERPEVLLFDLDGNSPRPASASNLAALVRNRKWDFEVAIDMRGVGYVAYYSSRTIATPPIWCLSPTRTLLWQLGNSCRGQVTAGCSNPVEVSTPDRSGAAWPPRPGPEVRRYSAASRIRVEALAAGRLSRFVVRCAASLVLLSPAHSHAQETMRAATASSATTRM